MEKYVYLKKKDVERLYQTCPIIGQGSEGTLFYMGNGYVYKIYHTYSDIIDLKYPAIYDREGVNIAKIKKENCIKVRRTNIVQYIDKEGVILSKKDSLKKAMEAQEKIKLSSLPQGIIFVDERIKGCVLKYHSFSTNIYNIRIFPRKIRLIIFREILKRVKELTNHNIYHMDICQKPTEESKNTNILFRFPMTPEIVDLEGNSCIYTEFFQEKLKEKVERGLGVLYFELLSENDLEGLLETEERIMSEILWENGFSQKIISEFYQGKFTLERMEEHLNEMQRRLK